MGHEFGLRQGVGEHGAALVSDDKFERQVAGVASMTRKFEPEPVLSYCKTKYSYAPWLEFAS